MYSAVNQTGTLVKGWGSGSSISYPYGAIMQVNSVDRSPNWRPTGADLYSTGASRPAPERQQNLANPATVNPPAVPGVNAAAPSPKAAEPDAPSVVLDPSTDWTIKKPVVEKPEIPPPKPLYLKLIEHLQSMWRASGNAVEVLDEVSKNASPARLVQEPLVYPDPKVKKVSGS